MFIVVICFVLLHFNAIFVGFNAMFKISIYFTCFLLLLRSYKSGISVF